MPQSVLSYARVNELLSRPLSPERLDEILFASKAELVRHDGDELQLSVTPDRLDLLSEGGLALYLQGVLGEARGLAPILPPAEAGTGFEIRVDAGVDAVRPEIAGLIVRSPEASGIDAGTLAEAIRFQELLHAGVGRDRRSASLGIYALERIQSPLRYALEPIRDVRFDPLDGVGPVAASEFLGHHPLATRYRDLGVRDDACLVLRDAEGDIASLPPILNSRGSGEVRPGDRTLLLESTGRRRRAVEESLQSLLVVFAARGYSVEPVPVARADGRSLPDGTALIAPRRLRLAASELTGVVGASLASDEVVELARRSRLGVHPQPGGWGVEASPWRTDLLGAVDIAEEILLARGLGVDAPVLLPSYTLGRRSAETRFRRRFGPVLLGAGFSPVYTPVLVSNTAVERAERKPGAIHLVNAPSAEFSYARPSLAVSLLESLRRNLRSGYPQRVSESGPVLVRADSSESGADTRFHIGFAIAADRAGFADAASLVDFLLRSVDVAGVRESIDLPATIPGRAARVRIAGEPVAELGEIHPRVLEEIGVTVPVAWGELDLSALWPLVRPPGTV